MKDGANTPPSTVVSGVVTGIRLLAVMVLQRLLRAAMVSGIEVALPALKS